MSPCAHLGLMHALRIIKACLHGALLSDAHNHWMGGNSIAKLANSSST